MNIPYTVIGHFRVRWRVILPTNKYTKIGSLFPKPITHLGIAMPPSLKKKHAITFLMQKSSTVENPQIFGGGGDARKIARS